MSPAPGLFWPAVYASFIRDYRKRLISQYKYNQFVGLLGGSHYPLRRVRRAPAALAGNRRSRDTLRRSTQLRSNRGRPATPGLSCQASGANHTLPRTRPPGREIGGHVGIEFVFMVVGCLPRKIFRAKKGRGSEGKG